LTAAIGFKRLAYAFAAVAVAGIAVLVVMPLLVPAEAVREAVKAELRATTGLEPELRGDTTVSLFPSGTATLTDVALGDNRSDPAPITVERMTVRLRLLPLLTGRVEVADVLLVRPTIAVTLAADGSNWAGLVDALARALTSHHGSFSEIRVSQGRVEIRDPARGTNETLSDVDVSLAWPSIAKTFAATGRFTWRGEVVDASIGLSDFLAGLMGERSGLKVRLSGAPLKLAFDGHVSHRPTLKIDGTLAADATSLREVVRWAAQRPLPDGGFGRFALKAQTSMTSGAVALSRVNVELDGNSAEGVLNFGADNRQTLQGTLATEALNLTPYVSAVRLLTANDRGWDSTPIGLDGLTGFDLDLRLSAGRVAIGSAKLGRTAVVANMRGGRLTVSVGESQAFGGTIKGSFGLAKSAAGADLKADLQFADVDLESCLGELFGLRRLEGKGQLALTLDGSGDSILAVARSVNGSAVLTSRQGALNGLNVDQLLRRLERRPLSGSAEFRSGRTPFDELNVAIKIAQGKVMAEDIRIEASTLRVALGGSASIPTRDLDLRGTASLLTSSPAGPAPAFELPFVVQGRWDDPLMLPDPQILIRRSGAAAPLLDAVRERRGGRDAVRSAIERLTGTPPAAPASEAVPAEPGAQH
jgi:AsmA protein